VGNFLPSNLWEKDRGTAPCAESGRNSIAGTHELILGIKKDILLVLKWCEDFVYIVKLLG